MPCTTLTDEKGARPSRTLTRQTSASWHVCGSGFQRSEGNAGPMISVIPSWKPRSHHHIALGRLVVMRHGGATVFPFQQSSVNFKLGGESRFVRQPLSQQREALEVHGSCILYIPFCAQGEPDFCSDPCRSTRHCTTRSGTLGYLPEATPRTKSVKSVVWVWRLICIICKVYVFAAMTEYHVYGAVEAASTDMQLEPFPACIFM